MKIFEVLNSRSHTSPVNTFFHFTNATLSFFPKSKNPSSPYWFPKITGVLLPPPIMITLVLGEVAIAF